MLVPFRQGLVEYSAPLLTVGANYVTLNVAPPANPVILTFANGTTDYLFLETQTATNAWGPIYPNIDQWLYWDIDLLTAARTFGITKYNPVVQFTQPPSPATDQHWFDLSTGLMKVWNGIVWTVKVRLFACKLSNGVVPISVSSMSPLFSGTQVGLNIPTYAGVILFDVASNKPLRTANNTLLTGETYLRAVTGATSGVKVEAILVEAEAQQYMASYSVVTFSDFGKIIAANEFTAAQGLQFGIIETSANIGDVVNVTTTGVITNPAWSWGAVNNRLYSDHYGQLTTMPPAGNVAPIGIIIDINKILLYASQSQIGSSGGGGGGGGGVATPTSVGTVELSVASATPATPVVVGTNDPRIVNALQRTGDTMLGNLNVNGNLIVGLLPAAVNGEPVEYGQFTAANLASALALSSGLALKVNKSGDTMSGNLAMGGHKVTSLAAATTSGDAVRYDEFNALATSIPLTYETISAAAATYETISAAALTYETITHAMATYETSADANATFLTIANAVADYLSIANANATFLTIANAGLTYETIATANSTFLTISTAIADYETKADANATFLTISNAMSTYLPLAGGTLSGTLNMGNNYITNLLTPVNPTDAATKGYVDSLVSAGLETFVKINGEISSTIVLGMPVYSSGPGAMARAHADSNTTTEVIGLVSSPSINIGVSGNMQTEGILYATQPEWQVITGEGIGLTEGAVYYLLDSAPYGSLTKIAPSTTGHYVVVIGTALSNTNLFINIQQPILL